MNSNQFLAWLERQNNTPPLKTLEKPLIMGVVNITSESFSDGGAFLAIDKACEHTFKLIEEGADIIDIGGESTRPGAVPVSVDIELTRVIPIIEHIRARSDVCISIDTYKPEVMSAAVSAGANIINDIFALQYPGAEVMAAQLAVPVCLMHMQGTPQNMQLSPQYPDGVINAVLAFFKERIDSCVRAGMNKSQLILDPGFGFGKLAEHNLMLMKRFEDFKEFNLPLLLGVSRKSTIGAVLNKVVEERLIGSIALAVYAALKGVGILRTHDVNETNQALTMIDAVNKRMD